VWPRPELLLVPLALTWGAAGCTRKQPDQAVAAGSADAALAAEVRAAPPPSAPAASASSPGAAAPSPVAEDCGDGDLVAAKSIGHTSVVFKIELAGGKKAAWKPNSRRGKGRYKGEIAAYRLGIALGIPNVPPACFRVFDATTVSRVLGASEATKKLLDDEVVIERVDGDGNQGVRGAVIPWIDGLQFWPLDKEPLRSQVQGWLRVDGTIPPEQLELARQASTLALFDFLTSNWDRYSGGNVGLDKAGQTVLFIDNDAAFMAGPPKDALAKNEALVAGIDRFSRSVVERLRALDDAGLARTFGEETPGRALLEPAVVKGVAERRTKLLALIDRKVASTGEPRTLYFR
jgi:hypothetical protein